MNKLKYIFASTLGVLAWILSFGLIVSPWIYHIVYCFQNKEYVLLLVGAVLVPIGWLHGLGAFFGWW